MEEKSIWKDKELFKSILSNQETEDIIDLFEKTDYTLYDCFQIPIAELCNSKEEFLDLLELIYFDNTTNITETGRRFIFYDEIIFEPLDKPEYKMNVYDVTYITYNRDNEDYLYYSLIMYANSRNAMLMLKTILIMKIAKDHSKNYYNSITGSKLVFEKIDTHGYIDRYNTKCKFVLKNNYALPVLIHEGPSLFKPINSKFREIKSGTTNKPDKKKKNLKNKMIEAYLLLSFMNSTNKII